MVLTFGSIFVPLLEKFREDRATTATVQSLCMGMMLGTGIIWGLVIKRFGLTKMLFMGAVLVPLGYIVSYFANSIFQLTLLIGLTSGLGIAIMYVGTSIAVQRSFTGKGKGIALAVHNTAMGLGTVWYPYLLDYLVTTYGVSGSFLILGGINLNNFVVAFIVHYKVREPSKKTSIYYDTNTKDEGKPPIGQMPKKAVAYVQGLLKDLASYRLIAVVASTALSVGSLNGFLVVVLDVYAFKGFNTKQALDSFTVFNSVSVLGRLLPALFQRLRFDPVIVLILCASCGCGGLIMVLFTKELWMMFLGSGLAGISVGGSISGAGVAILTAAPIKRFDEAFGTLITVVGVFSSSLGPLFGWMRDDLQSYSLTIVLSACLQGGTV